MIAGPRRHAGLSWAQAYATAWQVGRPLAPVSLPVGDALRHVLAAPVEARTAAPAFDAAAMDGYAVAGAGPWRVAGRVLAGDPEPVARLDHGDAVEIATGARVPAGAEAVLPYEDCHRCGDTVRGTRTTRTHIRRAGEDTAPGDLLAPAGRVLTATAAAAAAQVGVERVRVRPRPGVDVLVTGDEVVLHGRPGPGQVRDVFAPLVTAITDRAGGRLRTYRRVEDDPTALRAAIDTSDAPVLVVTGSSSVGVADHLHDVLAERSATWHVDGVACRPGHPQALARTADGRWVVGLPGNPYAGLVAALTLLEPLLAALAGHRRRPLPVAPVSGTVKLFPGGCRIVPVETVDDGARIVPGARSGSLRAAASADALAVLDAGWATGTPAPLLRLP
ncbi:molybdopterin-binding protein [Dactylosporangium siamense]|uniref:Molybdopterin molybdenumtransferase n=1 Tax=Dactylosporangium siamense TaxID=685454 RepID=A0A919UHA1_9ACTN|nr:molybdopterin-binding protein [Dactylosporangium siamense]GIG52196.1 molybdopterin molybdenumtransferase MoeA [Dactylosporangium siamense]